MSRSRLPLIALVGAVGCTDQEYPVPGEEPPAATSPLQELKDESYGDVQGKGSGIRGLTPEERRRLQYGQHMQELRDEAARRETERDAGVGRTPEQLAADTALATGPVPENLAGQRRQQLARERVETERFRKHGKGGGIKKSETLRIIRGKDATTAPPPAPELIKD
jgi:hypothetical protein